ncbi:glycosyltransferase [Lactobacillus sp. PV037]|uniref:glycosyltransferase n=1 Tax=Lactobacillus sp. PV037 TaxID=2594496 RepID=UPI00223F0672|nr:glycosyltransferase [Lactobacillus sp. PV037]QNQ83117.1 glycosyltransferase [Lactobacillus sp. PV037]
MHEVSIGIIILNYLAYEETKESVYWLKKQIKDEFKIKIVIVDNASDNGSYDILKKEFTNDPLVEVEKTKKNLGFAQGNNYGYDQIKKYMNPDFIIVSNSDAYAKKEGLFEWIVNEYAKEKFGVLGPSIYSKRGNFYQSPGENETRNIHELHKKIRNLNKYLIKLRIKKFLNYKESFEIPKWPNHIYKDRTKTKTLHGAFQVFSKNYFEKYNELYDSRTFLYREEDILKVRCDREQLLMVYSPEYEVEHLQAVSTSKASKSILDQKINRTKNLLNSTKVYEKVLKESKLTE